MNIGSTGSAAATNHNAQPPRRAAKTAPDTPCDRVRTSSHARMLSQSLATLKKQLLPRDEVLEKFAGSIEEPMQLDDQTLDGILNHL